MSAEAPGIIDDGWPERLTCAIRSGFTDIERRYRDTLVYDGVPLRGVMERSVYQQAVMDSAGSLAPALSSDDRDAFATWFQKLIGTDRSNDARAYLKAWVRLISNGLIRPAGHYQRRNEAAGLEFVFHVLRPRFIDFFWPVIERLGSHRCAVLCEPGYGVAEAARQRGLAVCDRVSVRLRLGSVRRPPRRVFPLYANAIVGLLDALGTLRRYRPRAVVFAEAASSLEEVVAQACRALGTPTIRVQYGRAGLLSPGYYNMPYDKMLMWGEGFAERLRGVSPDSQYIVTGSPLMDRFAQGGWRSEPPLFSDGKDVVTVISQPECANISRHDYESLVKVVEGVLLGSDAINLLVRLHPADKAGDFSRLAERFPGRVRVTAPEDFTLESVIGRSTIVIGLYSTVLSEAVAAGVLPVVIRLGERHRIFPSPEDEGAAALARSPDEAVTQILRLATDVSARNAYVPAMRLFANKYFGPADGGATDRVVAQIENAG